MAIPSRIRAASAARSWLPALSLLWLIAAGMQVPVAAEAETERSNEPPQTVETSQPQQSPVAGGGDDADPAPTVLRPRSSRLRFRDGPTCMCSDGLRESDIASGSVVRRER